MHRIGSYDRRPTLFSKVVTWFYSALDTGATIGWLAAPAVGVPSWVKMTDAYTLRRGYASPPTLAVILKTEENIIFEFYEFRISQCAGPGQVGICPCDQSS